MSFKLLSLSTMYPGYLASFYNEHPETSSLTYKELNELLVEKTTEVAGSYIRNFRRSGIIANCIIANDEHLQGKWADEFGINSSFDRKIIFNQVKHFQPDVLWIENLSIADLPFLENVRNQVKSVRLIVGCHCAPFNQKVLNSLRGIDFVITCTPGLKSIVESLGTKSYLIYHGFDEDLLSQLDLEPGNYSTNFIFSGSLIPGGNFHNERIRLIEQILKENIDIDLYVNLEKKSKILAKQSLYLANSILNYIGAEKLADKIKILDYGKSWVKMYSDSLIKSKRPPVFGMGMYNLFRHSKIVLNYHIGVAGNYAGNMRMFEVTGVGSCLLTDNKKNMGELFDAGSEVIVYDNAEDCIAKVKWLLEHEEERKKIAASGQQRTLKAHSVTQRCESIIEILNNELKSSGKLI
jgi:spore maturation protein CgeB